MSSERVPSTPVRNQDDGTTSQGPMPNNFSHNSVATEPLTHPLSQIRFTQLRLASQQSAQGAAENDLMRQPMQPPTSPGQVGPSAGVAHDHDNVQVPQSSPRIPTPAGKQQHPYQRTPGPLAQSFAPPGISYQPPNPAADSSLPPQLTIVSDDSDGPSYLGSSGHEDQQFLNKTSIKPSTLAQREPGAPRVIAPGERVPETPLMHSVPPGASSRFRTITESSMYNPNATKRPAEDDLDGSRPLKLAKEDTTQAPSKENISITDIKDFQQRISVNRMLQIVPSATVAQCLKSLKKAKGQWGAALANLKELVTGESSAPPPRPRDDDDDDDGITALQRAPRQPPQPAAKQKIKSHARIQDRWAASGTQAVPRQAPVPKPSPPPVQVQQQPPVSAAKAPLRRLVRGQRPGTPMTTSTTSSRAASPTSSVRNQGPTPVENKKGGRLVRGRRPVVAASSDVEEAVPSDASSNIDEADGELAVKVLKFFNGCSASDLADIAEIPETTAVFLISKRPFSSLKKVRQVTTDLEQDASATTTRRGRAKAKKPIGDKIVDKCMDVWTGYEAVDALVSKCESLGKPVAEEMKNWGVDIFGDATGNKELEMVSLEDKGSDESDDSDEDIS
ncbi:hypothetical protein KEM56_004194, partial [Ascosphaera pollenicola]